MPCWYIAIRSKLTRTSFAEFNQYLVTQLLYGGCSDTDLEATVIGCENPLENRAQLITAVLHFKLTRMLVEATQLFQLFLICPEMIYNYFEEGYHHPPKRVSP